MVHVTQPQPYGTPTWWDLRVPDLEKALEFYGAIFGWTFEVGPPETGRYTMCLLDGKPVAGLSSNAGQGATECWWTVYFATDDCDATAKRIADAGGTLTTETMEIPGRGRLLLANDSVGTPFALWEAGPFVGAATVNEPNSLLRNDLITAEPERARSFYASVFDFTLDGDPNSPERDFTFLRRPDGHEIGGVLGDSKAAKPRWEHLFLVTDADAAAAAATAAGGAGAQPEDFFYGRVAEITDPFGARFAVGSPPKRS
jgi:predicted enzyme related to lactoylglutathione lyase